MATITTAGQLNQRVTFQRNTPVQDQATGAMVDNWADAFTVWAHVAPLSARDFIAAQAASSEVVARIVVRYRAEIVATMRIVYRGEIYSIAGVLPDQESGLQFMTLPVSRGVKRG